jgi:hypothetical protein
MHPTPHSHPHRPRNDVPMPRRMSRRFRLTLVWVSSLIWLTGLGWMLLHYFLQQPGEFGATPHPLEPITLRIHGLLAIMGIFLFGWISGRHVIDAWYRRNQHISGVWLFVACLLLASSGYALFYVTHEASHQTLSIIHQVIGIGIAALAWMHWRVYAR